MVSSPDRDSAEVTLRESARSAAADAADLAETLDGAIGDPSKRAAIADRLSEELAEVAQMLRSLPGRPADGPASDWQLLAGLRTAHRSGEDVAAAIGRAAARLAWELGDTFRVVENRPGSWEAAVLADLLQGTVGTDLAPWKTTR